MLVFVDPVNLAFDTSNTGALHPLSVKTQTQNQNDRLLTIDICLFFETQIMIFFYKIGVIAVSLH